MLNLKYLETFIRVTEAGSFHKAADLMYITPSAVIKQVKMLEDEVGAELFRRSPRGLSLTKNGESLYQDGKILLDAAENSLRRAREASGENDYVLRVGTSPITPADLVAGLWEKVYSEWPQLKIQIVPFQNAGREVNEIFLNFGRDIDILCGVVDPVHLKYRHCSGIPLVKYKVNIAVPLSHPFARKSSVTLRELRGEEMMLLSEGKMEVMDRIRKDLKEKEPDIRITDFDIYGIDVFNRCEHTGAVLATMENWVKAHPALKMIPVDWDYELEYGLLYAEEPSDKVKRFIDIVR